MKLTGKVVKIESASEFADKKQRVVFKINDSFHGSLEVTNEDRLSLDDEIEIFVFRKVREDEKSIEDAVAAIPIEKAS